MRLDPPRPRRTIEVMLPMIDVVFFLIVFFMIVSQVAEPEPFALVRPEAGRTEPVRAPLALYLDANGVAGHVDPEGALTGADALSALMQARAALCARADCLANPPGLLLHADASAPGAALARIMADLSAEGFGAIRLVTVRR